MIPHFHRSEWPRPRRWLVALLSLVLIGGLPLPGLSFGSTPAVAAQGGCLGSGARQIRYTTNGVLRLEGCGQVFTLTDVAAATADPHKLELVDPANKIWFLKVNLLVGEGAALIVRGGRDGDVNWLRLRSDNAGAVSLRAENGALRFEATKLTSWNHATNTVDTDFNTAGRAYVAARSIWTAGRTTAPPTACAIAGGSRDAYEARMDVIDSEFAYLGYYDAESYGLTWKVYSKTAPAGRRLYDMVDIFGDVTGSYFHHNYYGAYTYGGYCMRWANNVFEHNVEYGLDPHDDSDYLTIENNIFRHNGNHGLICSVACNNLVIRGNISHHNRHGIMLHNGAVDALVEQNQVYDNRASGIAISDGHGNRILNNTVTNNSTAAIQMSGGASRNVVAHNILAGPRPPLDGKGLVIYMFDGTESPAEGGGWPRNNVFHNNLITGYTNPMLRLGPADGNHFEANTINGPAPIPGAR